MIRLPFTQSKREKEIKEKAERIAEFVGIVDSINRWASDLVWTERQLVQIGRALINEPQLLLLDEPVAGMNPSEKTELMTEILNIKQRGFSIFMIEHDMRFVMGLCDRVAVLNFGKIIAEGTPDQIKNNQEVIEAYLGAGH